MLHDIFKISNLQLTSQFRTYLGRIRLLYRYKLRDENLICLEPGFKIQKASLEHLKLGYYHGRFFSKCINYKQRLLYDPRFKIITLVIWLYSSVNYLFWCKLWPKHFRRTPFRWNSMEWFWENDKDDAHSQFFVFRRVIELKTT